jgi:hypothetical protein
MPRAVIAVAAAKDPGPTSRIPGARPEGPRRPRMTSTPPGAEPGNRGGSRRATLGIPETHGTLSRPRIGTNARRSRRVGPSSEQGTRLVGGYLRRVARQECPTSPAPATDGSDAGSHVAAAEQSPNTSRPAGGAGARMYRRPQPGQRQSLARSPRIAVPSNIIPEFSADTLPRRATSFPARATVFDLGVTYGPSDPDGRPGGPTGPSRHRARSREYSPYSREVRPQWVDSACGVADLVQRRSSRSGAESWCSTLPLYVAALAATHACMTMFERATRFECCGR